MKRTFILAIAAPRPGPPRLRPGGLQATARSPSASLQRDSDTNSSKFLEYRDIPQGAGGVLRCSFDGKKGDFRYRFLGTDVTQKDQRYSSAADNDTVRLDGNYTGIPHNFGNGGKSLLSPVDRERLAALATRSRAPTRARSP